MPTFDPGRVPEAQLRAAVRRSAQAALQDIDIDKDTLRDIRHRVEKDLGWGAFHSREKKELKRAVLEILRDTYDVPGEGPPR